jgi:hypothetical protein
VPLPFILITKAVSMMRAARPVLTEWSRLDPEEKRRVQHEADDVRRSLLLVGRALGGRLRDSKDKGITWEQGRKLALSPRPEFLVARDVVDVVLRATQVAEAELRSRFTGEPAARLTAALLIAEKDGYIARSRRGCWHITEFADRMLVDSDEIVFMEQAINEHIRRVGLVGRDELAFGVGSPDSDSAEFLAAVERALVAGTIAWLGPGMYGLPTDQLAAMQPPPAADTVAAPDSKELKPLLQDLKREIDELRRAVATARAGALPSPTGGISPPGGSATRELDSANRQTSPSAKDPATKLRELKVLCDDGIISEADFERKKTDILSQM